MAIARDFHFVVFCYYGDVDDNLTVNLFAEKDEKSGTFKIKFGFCNIMS